MRNAINAKAKPKKAERAMHWQSNAMSLANVVAAAGGNKVSALDCGGYGYGSGLPSPGCI